MSNDENDRCRICGYLQSEPPWGVDGNSPTFDICECCGIEFGYGDGLIHAIRSKRRKWLEEGAPWFNPRERPDDWNLEDQLRLIPPQFQ